MSMKCGTIVRLPDGREGTVVYHNLDGYGIKWGRHAVTDDDIGGGNWLAGIHDGGGAPDAFPWFPDAMLKKPNPYATLECVGDDYEIVSFP